MCLEHQPRHWVDHWTQLLNALPLFVIDHVAVEGAVSPDSLLPAHALTERAGSELRDLLGVAALRVDLQPRDHDGRADLMFALVLLLLLHVASEQGALPNRAVAADAPACRGAPVLVGLRLRRVRDGHRRSQEVALAGEDCHGLPQCLVAPTAGGGGICPGRQRSCARKQRREQHEGRGRRPPQPRRPGLRSRRWCCRGGPLPPGQPGPQADCLGQGQQLHQGGGLEA
mmetsp:Transcript_42197/g.109155  ORF Transcript_42197/g.109155 Transcript_42197/m.109155 type:complete len:228 (+) Transcript_42197:266-949(+)